MSTFNKKTMKAILKKLGMVFLITIPAFIAGYTFVMGLLFSLTGMWVTDTNLMWGYTGTFIVSALLLLFLLIKTGFFAYVQKVTAT